MLSSLYTSNTYIVAGNDSILFCCRRRIPSNVKASGTAGLAIDVLWGTTWSYKMRKDEKVIFRVLFVTVPVNAYKINVTHILKIYQLNVTHTSLLS